MIEAAGRGGATVPLPFDPKSEFGKARAPIRGTLNGAPFRSTALEVDVPPELAAVLEGDSEAAQGFEKLSYTHRREYARWIAEAKRAETKERRVAKAAEMLRSGTRSPDASSTVEEGRPN